MFGFFFIFCSLGSQVEWRSISQGVSKLHGELDQGSQIYTSSVDGVTSVVGWGLTRVWASGTAVMLFDLGEALHVGQTA